MMLRSPTKNNQIAISIARKFAIFAENDAKAEFGHECRILLELDKETESLKGYYMDDYAEGPIFSIAWVLVPSANTPFYGLWVDYLSVSGFSPDFSDMDAHSNNLIC